MMRDMAALIIVSVGSIPVSSTAIRIFSGVCIPFSLSARPIGGEFCRSALILQRKSSSNLLINSSAYSDLPDRSLEGARRESKQSGLWELLTFYQAYLIPSHHTTRGVPKLRPASVLQERRGPIFLETDVRPPQSRTQAFGRADSRC